MDRVDRAVRRALRLPRGLAESGNAKHASAGRHDFPLGEQGAGVEYLARFGGGIQARDRVALAGVVRIALGGEHDAERRSPVPLMVGPLERARSRVLEQIDEIRLEPHQNWLRLRIAQAAVELERARIAG